MAKILLLSVAQEDLADSHISRNAWSRLIKSAHMDRFKVHHLTDNPEEADIILFAEINGHGPYWENIRGHQYFKQYLEKCFVFDSSDYIICFLPGIFASIQKEYYQEERTRTGFYLSPSENPYIEFAPYSGQEKYLFSFVGSAETAQVRRDLLTLQEERFYATDTSSYSLKMLMSTNKEAQDQFFKSYCQIAYDSKFILCPRGLGVGSIRLFETMKMGRVPVILADGWVPPKGPDWSSFAIRVLEKDYQQIPALLKEREQEAIFMGLRAREAWEDWYAPDVCFHRVVDWCLDIQRCRTAPEKLVYLGSFFQLLRPFHFRHFLRTRYQRLRRELSNMLGV